MTALPPLKRRSTPRSTPLEAGRATAAASLGLIALWLAAPQASASPFELYGAGARGGAMAGALGALGRDGEAVFYNPALLTASQRPHLGAELQLVAPSLFVDRAAGSAEDADGGRTTALPDTSAGATLGLSMPFGSALGWKLSLGALAFIPALNSTRLDAVDPATPHFALHRALTDKLFVGAALAVEPVEGLSIGLGAQGLAGLSGSADALLDAERRRILRRRFEVDLDGTIAPILGLAWRGDAWSAGLTFRGRLALDYALPIEFTFAEGGRAAFFIEGTTLFTPDQLNLALGWAESGWAVALDVTWARWSQAPTSASTVVTSIDDAGLGEGEATTLLEMASADVSAGFVDTLVPRIGVERSAGERLVLRAGYSFRPTPVPNQVGYTNSLDNHAHQLGLGAGWRLGPGVELRAFAQATALQDRAVTKIPQHDPLGIGDYVAGGVVWHGGLAWHQDL